MADLAGAVIQIVVIDGALVETGEVVGREAAVKDHENGVKAQDEGDGVLVLPCRLGFLDDGLALDLGEGQVRDGVNVTTTLVRNLHHLFLR